MEIPRRSATEPAPGSYDDLPEPIKSVVTPQEWAWMSDAQKQHLVQEETEPDWEE